MPSLKTKIKEPFKAGQNAFLSGKSIYYDPYRNMGPEFSYHQSLWYKGYENAKKNS